MDKRYSRRRFLQWGGAGGAVLVAGCGGGETDTAEDEGNIPSIDPAETNEQSPAPTESPTETETETNETETNETEPQPPQPDIVVAADGSGDYDSLDLGLEAAGGEAVIKIKSGRYTGNISNNETTLVGVGRGETTVILKGSNLPYNVQFWNLAAQASETERFETHYNGAIRLFDSMAEFGFNIGRGGVISLHDTKVTGVINTERLRATNSQFPVAAIAGFSRKSTPVKITDSQISGGLAIGGTTQFTKHEIRDTVIKGPLSFDVEYPSSFLLTGSEVQGVTFAGDHDDDRTPPQIRDSMITANDDIGAAVRMNGDGNLISTKVDIRQSKITASSATTNAAINCSGGNAVTIVDNTIEGTIEGSSQTGAAKWNTFKNPAPNTVNWFIDGEFVPTIVGNAFIGGDIRLQNDETEVYDIDQKVGNFYSTYDGTDSDSDGIYDNARTLPGDADLIDEFPLASSEFSQYKS